MVFTEEDIELVKKFIGIRDRGHYCNSQQLTDCYNRCLEKNVHNTSCGQCMRKRISELETALKQWESKQQEEKLVITNEQTSKTEGVITITEETENDSTTTTHRQRQTKKGKKSNPKAT